jgi:hypothetical protein
MTRGTQLVPNRPKMDLGVPTGWMRDHFTNTRHLTLPREGPQAYFYPTNQPPSPLTHVILTTSSQTNTPTMHSPAAHTLSHTHAHTSSLHPLLVHTYPPCIHALCIGVALLILGMTLILSGLARIYPLVKLLAMVMIGSRMGGSLYLFGKIWFLVFSIDGRSSA